MANRWYDLSPDEVAKITDTDPVSGLSQDKARARIEKDGPNKVFTIPKPSFGEYMKKLSVNTLSILLALSCIPAVIFDHVSMAIILIATLALNYIAVAVTYVKAQEIFLRMGHLALPTAKVVRGGRMTLVRQENIAYGDVICLSAGDIVPCDARLIEDENLVVLEAGITEARHPVRKDSAYRNIRMIQPHEAINMVYASTIVKSGSGKAIACRMGKDTLVCKSEKNKSAVSYDKLSLFDKLHKISFYATLVTIALTFVLTIINMLPSFGKFDALDGLISALSFGCGAMTEFYAIFGYIIVAVGIFGSLNSSSSIGKGALIKNAEKLDAICSLDTIIIPPEAAAAVKDITLDRVYIENNDDAWCSRSTAGFDDICARLVSYAVISTGLYGERLAGINAAGNNIFSCEEEAIIRAAEDSGLYNRELDNKYSPREHLGKCDYCNFDVTLTKHGGDNIVIARGTAEDILNACNRFRDTNGKIRPLNAVMRSKLLTIAAQMSRERGIVTAIAAVRSIYTTLVRLSDTLSDMVFEGFLCFSEPMLPGIELSVDKCRSAGIDILLFSSERSERNVRIAASSGITDFSRDEIFDANMLATMSDAEVLPMIDRFKVFENMDAAAECRIIRLLRSRGKKVGFLGLQFDEITAMRDADVSFTQSITLSDKKERAKRTVKIKKKGDDIPLSVSKSGGGAPSGCDALRFVSDVILSVVSKNDSHGGINALVLSIERARMIYSGVFRLMTYLFTVNVARLIILLYTFASGVFILTPVQMLICGMLYDLAAVMIIAFERPYRGILSAYSAKADSAQGKHKGVLASLLVGICLGVCGILLSLILSAVGASDTEKICTPIFVSLLLSSIVILVEGGNKNRLFSGNLTLSNMLLTVVLSISLLIALGMIFPKFGALFGIYRMSLYSWIGVLATVIGTVLLLELFKRKEAPKSRKTKN